MATFWEVFFPQSLDSRAPSHPAQAVVPLPGGGKRSHWPAEMRPAARSCPLGVRYLQRCNVDCPSSTPTSLSSEMGFLNSICLSVENDFEIISFPNNIVGSQI